MSETSRDFGPFVGGNWLSMGRERLLELWVLGLTLSAAGLCGGLIAAGYRIHQPWAVAVLAALAFAAEYGTIRLSPSVEMTIASLVCVFAAVVLGPLSGAVVATAGLLRDLPRRDTAQPILRWASWTSKGVLATVAAGLTAALVLSHSGKGFLGLFFAVAAAFVVETIVGDALALVAPAIRGSSSMRATFRDIVPSDLVSVPLHVPTA
ncbi:MAG TPA: ECF transporter S component, partial [Solirubrobacterales bacterium]